MKNRILFLLFIFSVLGFLFFSQKTALAAVECICGVFTEEVISSELTNIECDAKSEITTGGKTYGDCKWFDGNCTCEIIVPKPEIIDVADESACTDKVGTTVDGKTYKECTPSLTPENGICKCDIVNADTGDVEYQQDITDESEAVCDEFQGKIDGDKRYENCFWWVGAVGGEVSSGPEEGDKAMDIPSVAGLNTLGSTDVKVIFGKAIYIATGLLGSIALALFAYAGVLWMLSGGNAEQATKARNILIWATMGLFVILASYTIVSFIFSAVE